jgi:hypothetical protein
VQAAPAQAHVCYGDPVQCGSCEISTRHQHICMQVRDPVMASLLNAHMLA